MIIIILWRKHIYFFVYLEPLNDYCHSCGMIGLVDDDTTPLVSSSYINESCIYVCELCIGQVQ